ncbi:hypothetical protein M409DRAFT_50094 [Zasmidium cellare ATCC 36951]|uniref:Mating-type alpha-pheromone receptor PreB n=1 Tax=Zasmidium cellare ATCC 36951 TaxID=1080233 RepID=A0A6A6D408_ZASCE|nr:uncharacterized protein M409DRAFT_50094 [Zasmidium cellare ATCC 36951]KAF2172386.1 hypothetical protein M409DRAFT_50094 [Zasmidium cellare ATCC 36951]
MASTLDSVPNNGSFDPYHQQIIITMPDGQTQFATSIHNIFELQHLAVTQTAVFAVQIGLSAVLMTVLALMTQADKRRSLIFIFNLTALLFIFIRGIVQCVQTAGPLYNFYNWTAEYYPDDSVTSRQSVVLEVCSFIMVMAIELSLMLQVRIVCCTLSTFWRRCLDCLSILAVTATLAIRFVCMILNILWNIVDVGNTTENEFNMIAKLSNVSIATLMASIFLFSGIFSVKLLVAIRQRRDMGMKSFGAVQIIFIMGCQTMIVPALFGIISYWAIPGSQLYTMTPVVVATFLPLSSIWASTSTKGNNNIAAPHQWHNRREKSTLRNPGTPAYSSEKGLLPTTVNTDCTLVDDRSASVSEPSPRKPGHADSGERDSIDLEMQKMGRIRVDRAYSVRSD